MSNVQNWAMAALTAGLILVGPIIAFVVVITMEMLTDMVAQVGVTMIWPVAAGAMAWLLWRKFGGQPDASQWSSEGA